MTRPYPNYTITSEAWLGKVPPHWAEMALKRLVDLRSGSGITSEQIEEVGPYPVFGGNGLRGYADDYTHDGNYVLIGRQGALCGNVNYATGRFWASEHALVATPRKHVAVRWLGELLRAMNLNQYSTSAAQPGLAAETLGELRVVVPPVEEQEAIAGFLDRETGKIDALVEEQRRLIALLKEKRQAVISHAVTKGLDPSAPMKPSGIPWLGDIPAHWAVKRLRWVCDVFPSSVDKHSNEGESPVKLCNYTDVYYNELITDEIPFMIATATDPEITKFALVADDVVFTKDSETSSDIGIAAYVPNSLPGVVYGYHLSIARPRSGVKGLFVKRLFDSAAAKAYFEVSANGLTRVGLGQRAINDLPIPVPPLEEQEAIASFIDRETAKIGALVDEAFHSEKLLLERRAALIVAAVTGKIDVREAAAEATEAAE